MKQLDTLQDLLDFADRDASPVVLLFKGDDKNRWEKPRFKKAIVQYEHQLNASNIEFGDHVALIGENSPHWIAACLAILNRGAVVIPIDEQSNDDTLSHILDDVSPQFIFTTEKHQQRVSDLAPDIQQILLGKQLDEKQVKSPIKDENHTAVSPSDNAIIFYTSGTTGLPKGVPLIHSNIAFEINKFNVMDIVRNGDQLYNHYPFTMPILW